MRQVVLMKFVMFQTYVHYTVGKTRHRRKQRRISAKCFFFQHCSEVEFVLQYLAQRKKQETEEKRVKQKIAREQFLVMLEVYAFLAKGGSFVVSMQDTLLISQDGEERSFVATTVLTWYDYYRFFSMVAVFLLGGLFLCFDNLCIHWFASLKPGMQGADINHAMEVCLFSTEICIRKDVYICVLILQVCMVLNLNSTQSSTYIWVSDISCHWSCCNLYKCALLPVEKF